MSTEYFVQFLINYVWKDNIKVILNQELTQLIFTKRQSFQKFHLTK